MRNWILVLGVLIIVLGLSRLTGNLMPESDATQADMIVSIVMLVVGAVVAFASRLIKDKK